MFLGQLQHQLDEKGRIRIPAKFKDELGARPYITRGSNNCLFVIPAKDVEKILEVAINANGLDDSPQVQAARFLFSSAVQCEEDKQGRISLPSNLIDSAQIKKNIVSIGMHSRIEIWSEENWSKYSNGVDFNAALRSLANVNKANQ